MCAWSQKQCHMDDRKKTLQAKNNERTEIQGPNRSPLSCKVERSKELNIFQLLFVLKRGSLSGSFSHSSNYTNSERITVVITPFGLTLFTFKFYFLLISPFGLILFIFNSLYYVIFILICPFGLTLFIFSSLYYVMFLLISPFGLTLSAFKFSILYLYSTQKSFCTKSIWH